MLQTLVRVNKYHVYRPHAESTGTVECNAKYFFSPNPTVKRPETEKKNFFRHWHCGTKEPTRRSWVQNLADLGYSVGKISNKGWRWSNKTKS